MIETLGFREDLNMIMTTKIKIMIRKSRRTMRTLGRRIMSKLSSVIPFQNHGDVNEEEGEEVKEDNGQIIACHTYHTRLISFRGLHLPKNGKYRCDYYSSRYQIKTLKSKLLN